MSSVATPLIVRVDRSVTPKYPPWVKRLVFPELEHTGPAEYSLGSVSQYRHPRYREKGFVITPQAMICNYGLDIENQLSLLDLLALKDMGIDIVRRYPCRGLALKSMAKEAEGYSYVCVPYLGITRPLPDGPEELDIYWMSADAACYSMAALQFRE